MRVSSQRVSSQLSSLPNPLVVLVFQCLCVHDVLRASAVCWRFWAMCKNKNFACVIPTLPNFILPVKSLPVLLQTPALKPAYGQEYGYYQSDWFQLVQGLSSREHGISQDNFFPDLTRLTLFEENVSTHSSYFFGSPNIFIHLGVLRLDSLTALTSTLVSQMTHQMPALHDLTLYFHDRKSSERRISQRIDTTSLFLNSLIRHYAAQLTRFHVRANWYGLSGSVLLALVSLCSRLTDLGLVVIEQDYAMLQTFPALTHLSLWHDAGKYTRITVPDQVTSLLLDLRCIDFRTYWNLPAGLRTLGIRSKKSLEFDMLTRGLVPSKPPTWRLTKLDLGRAADIKGFLPLVGPSIEVLHLPLRDQQSWIILEECAKSTQLKGIKFTPDYRGDPQEYFPEDFFLPSVVNLALWDILVSSKELVDLLKIFPHAQKLTLGFCIFYDLKTWASFEMFIAEWWKKSSSHCPPEITVYRNFGNETNEKKVFKNGKLQHLCDLGYWTNRKNSQMFDL
jgi:hypothetical protein